VTLLLAHPEAEDLGRFVEGTLSDPERAVVVDHIADCDDCRMLVVDAAEFTEPAKVERHSTRWMGVAASLMLVAMIGTLTYRQYRDPLAAVKKTYVKVENRPLEGRLSGFGYVPRHNNRGAKAEVSDLNVYAMKADAGDAAELKGDSAKILHARGIGLLLKGEDPKASIAPLRAAAERDPNNATYQSDLAASLIAAGPDDKPMLEQAVAACDRALRIDPRSPDALFNRAKALEALERPDEAVAAYDHYLEVDSSSRWADEARRNADLLRMLR
jgi:tetratricopeptide (TPR) repeat protein